MIDNFDNNNFVYEYLFLNNKAVMLIIDSSNFNIIDVNTSAEKFLKLNKFNIINKKLQDFCIGFENQITRDLISLLENNLSSLKICFNFNNNFFTVDSIASIINNDNKKFIHLIINKNFIEQTDTFDQTFNIDKQTAKAIFSQSENFIGLLDLDGRIIYANNSSINFIGERIENLLGKYFWETPWWNFSNRFSKMIQDAIKRAAKGELVNFETIHRDNNNEERFFDFLIKPIYNNEGEITFLFPEGRDITNKKKAIELLKESELYYKTLFDGANDAIFLISNGLFINCNNKVLQIFEAQKDDIIGRSPYDFSPKYQNNGRLSIDAANEKVKSALEGIPQFFEWTHKRLNGQLFQAEVSLNRIEKNGNYEIQAIVRDISERKSIEKVMFKLEEDFKNLFEFSPIPIMITDLEGIFLNVNEAFCEDLGFKYHEIIGKKSTDLDINVDKDSDDIFINKLRTDGEVKNFDFITSKRGKIQILLLSSKLIQYNNKNAILSATIDITERKLIERELTEYKNHLEVLVKNRTQQLEELNKELEAFSYSVSHDLRAPLRSIDGFSNAILEDYYDKLDDEGKDFLLRIRRAAKSMGQLIDSLLSLARLSKSEMIYEDVNLSNISKQILNRLYQSELSRNKKFIIEEKLILKADLQLMEILLTNLLENAWKFTKNKVISMIEIGKKIINDQEYFYVKDNGAGFDMSYQNKLFKPFQRLHSTEEFEGTGIGLATVKRIINRHKGTIWVESIINEGTTFYFSLEEKED